MKRILIIFFKPFSFFPALFMMYLIFQFSAQTGETSSQISLKATTFLVNSIDYSLGKDWSRDEKAEKIEEYHFYVRKAAHMTEYCILAITITLPLYVYGLRGLGLLLVAGLLSAGFAALDEYHQSFVAGRGPSARDVLIDTCGACFGILLTQLFCWIAKGGKRRLT